MAAAGGRPLQRIGFGASELALDHVVRSEGWLDGRFRASRGWGLVPRASLSPDRSA
jgi:hypothetical protein